MNASCILGVDPGLSGALALYEPASGELELSDIPTLNVGKGGANKLIVDEYALARRIDEIAPRIACVWLELVNGMPSIPGANGTRRGMGAQSAFNFGRTYGLIRGVCAANFLTIHDVTPATWKGALKAGGGKDQARLRASTLLPRHSGLWPLKKHDGRAEAALIALYGARQLGGA